MVCRLIDFALVILKLLFKVCEIIDISKMDFFNFCISGRVKKNQET